MSVSPEVPARRVPRTLIGGLVAAVVGLPLIIGMMGPANARAVEATQGTDFTMAQQTDAPARLVQATFGVKSLLLRAKLENVGNRPIAQYRIGWMIVYRNGNSDVSEGPVMNVPTEIAPRTVAEVPDQGVSGKLLNSKPREIMFFVDEARFSTGELWDADTHSIAVEAGNATPASAPDTETEGPFTCVFASVNYPEGTVIQEGNGPEQMCVRESVPPRQMVWVRTNKAARERSATVVHVPTPPPVYCVPKVPTEAGLCACENTGPFSNGAKVNSAKSAYQLRCDSGDWIQTFTPNVERR